MQWLKIPACILEHLSVTVMRGNYPKATFRDEGRTLRDLLTTLTPRCGLGRASPALSDLSCSRLSDTPLCVEEEFNERGMVVEGQRVSSLGRASAHYPLFTEQKMWPRNEGMPAVSQKVEQCPVPYLPSLYGSRSPQPCPGLHTPRARGG